ncbi:NAD-dependent epimerase/dehydratase family protein [Streptomyces sp. NPDC015130]|uniref:NAD-dependent epimerase/dehydratase family protein n=1 Tax=Streptomyces sp. NPDC015130 TaxID=3364940 RepID=UPI0036FEADD2
MDPSALLTRPLAGGDVAADVNAPGIPARSVFRAVSAELDGLPAVLAALRPEGPVAEEAVTVAGADGFVGGHVLERLLGSGSRLTVVATGHAERVVDRHCARFGRRPSEFADVRLLGYDDLREAAGSRDRWGTVVHCGHEAGDTLPSERPPEAGVAATRALVRAAAERGAHRFVLVSSASVGEEFTPFTEESLVAVRDPHARSQFVAEAYAGALEGAACRVTVLRAGLVYGHAPGDLGFLEHDAFANLLRSSARLGVMPRLEGRVPVCHVTDLTNSLLAAATGGTVSATRSVLVQRTYDLDALRAELHGVRVVDPQEWLTAVSGTGGVDTRMPAALLRWLNGPGWSRPVSTTCRPIIRQLTRALSL